MNESNWERYFGTPEKTADMLHHNGTLVCRECLLRDICKEIPDEVSDECMVYNRDILLEWLETRPLDTVTCELVYGENGNGVDGWWCQSCGVWFAATFEDKRLVEPAFCQCCGAKAVKS